MKSNGKNGHAAEEQASSVPGSVSSILEAEVGRPVSSLKIQDFSKTGKHARKAYLWYKSKPWDDWWDEFSTAADANGRLKYKTAWSFCRVKAKKGWERELLWEMIGPQPPTVNNHRAPWLGDWQRRRENGFWALDPTKMEGVKAVVKERQDAMEAAKAIAPLMLPHMQRMHRLTLEIDAAFGGSPYLANYPPDHEKNKKRVREYLAVLKAAVDQEKELWEMWMKAHGLNPGDAGAWLMMASIVGQQAGIAGAKGALAGQMIGMQQALQLSADQADIALVRDLRAKTEMYPGLTAPDITVPKDRKPA
jgi:hypothetical protein